MLSCYAHSGVRTGACGSPSQAMGSSRCTHVLLRVDILSAGFHFSQPFSRDAVCHAGVLCFTSDCSPLVTSQLSTTLPWLALAGVA